MNEDNDLSECNGDPAHCEKSVVVDHERPSKKRDCPAGFERDTSKQRQTRPLPIVHLETPKLCDSEHEKECAPKPSWNKDCQHSENFIITTVKDEHQKCSYDQIENPHEENEPVSNW